MLEPHLRFAGGLLDHPSHLTSTTDRTWIVAAVEGGMTNGAGMVRFSRGFMRFGKALPIVPVALKVSVPWGIRTHTLTSNFVANLFWFCFVPQIQLEATVLKPMTLQEVTAFVNLL